MNGIFTAQTIAWLAAGLVVGGCVAWLNAYAILRSLRQCAASDGLTVGGVVSGMALRLVAMAAVGFALAYWGGAPPLVGLALGFAATRRACVRRLGLTTELGLTTKETPGAH
ncbi:MAG: hypothetical protein ACYTFT_06090 [Planctomycetota bacterium]|jgi:hypothetical protein